MCGWACLAMPPPPPPPYSHHHCRPHGTGLVEFMVSSEDGKGSSWVLAKANTHTHTHARKYIEARNVTISMRLSQQSMWPNHHSILAWLHLSCGCVGVCVNEWVGWLQCVCAYPKTPANKAGSFSKDSAQYGFMYHRQQDLS